MSAGGNITTHHITTGLYATEFLSRRSRNTACMAPDVLDLVVAMLAYPLTGLGVAVTKVAEKAKEEAIK